MPKKQETAEFKELVEKLTATAPKGTARPSLAKAAAGFAKAVDLFNAAGADDAKTIEKLRKRIADLESEKANLKRKLENSESSLPYYMRSHKLTVFQATRTAGSRSTARRRTRMPLATRRAKPTTSRSEALPRASMRQAAGPFQPLQ